jgi:hypothetical protein
MIFYLATINEGKNNLSRRNFNFFESLYYFIQWVIPLWWLAIIVISIIATIKSRVTVHFRK